jgi:hypothetical protein
VRPDFIDRACGMNLDLAVTRHDVRAIRQVPETRLVDGVVKNRVAKRMRHTPRMMPRQASLQNTGPREGAVLDCAQMLAVPLAVFALHVGQTRTFGSARAGDTVVCVGRGDSIRLRVPRQSPGGNDYRMVFNKKLSLTLGPRAPRSPHHPPGVVARCTSR